MANYWYWSKRTKPTVVENEDELPDGTWLTVSEAAKVTGYSRQTLYLRFYTRECSGFKIGNGPLLINLHEVK